MSELLPGQEYVGTKDGKECRYILLSCDFDKNLADYVWDVAEFYPTSDGHWMGAQHRYFTDEDCRKHLRPCQPVTPSQPHDAALLLEAEKWLSDWKKPFGKDATVGLDKRHAVLLIEKLVAALRSSPATTAPDGWRLVPVEPTEDMLIAATAFAPRFKGDVPLLSKAIAAELFRTMLAAAPPAHDGEDRPETDPCDECGKYIHDPECSKCP